MPQDCGEKAERSWKGQGGVSGREWVRSYSGRMADGMAQGLHEEGESGALSLSLPSSS